MSSSGAKACSGSEKKRSCGDNPRRKNGGLLYCYKGRPQTSLSPSSEWKSCISSKGHPLILPMVRNQRSILPFSWWRYGWCSNWVLYRSLRGKEFIFVCSIRFPAVKVENFKRSYTFAAADFINDIRLIKLSLVEHIDPGNNRLASSIRAMI